MSKSGLEEVEVKNFSANIALYPSVTCLFAKRSNRSKGLNGVILRGDYSLRYDNNGTYGTVRTCSQTAFYTRCRY